MLGPRKVGLSSLSVTCEIFQLFIAPEYHVYEPLTAGTLETIAGSSSLETSYRRVTAFRAGDILEGPPSKPTGVQVDKLKILLDGEEAYVSVDGK